MDIPEFSHENKKIGEQLKHDSETEALILEVRSIFGFIAGEEMLHYESLKIINQHSTPPFMEKMDTANL
jgi:hypothetical protein